MNEDSLLSHIFRRANLVDAPRVLVGPGDDAAVVFTLGPSRLVLTVDQLIEGRHFIADTPLDLIARKAMARSVSDIAAMAATPVWSLCTAALPVGFAAAEASALFDAVHEWGHRFNCPVIGGDIATLPPSNTALCLTVTVIGELSPGQYPVLRSGAKPNDNVFVTGALGGSFDAMNGRGRHLTFEPRVAEALELSGTLGEHLHAMMDLSDGLGRDAGRMGKASGVQIAIDESAIPISPSARTIHGAIADGEDYELLFCVPPDVSVPACCNNGRTPITRIGRVQAGPPGAVLLRQGQAVDISQLGWEH